ncbi:hypothetical protein TVAG_322750 [Trichomonas vaginalis G3]|uniref:DUF3447 domain-containing protein n=1 Tax=Trichomonas vaginalis (strain ATCC PRA-98 / G3) TaxID=412133 RepID=A2EL27_TRIV3|nr:spectrin binding [Trichomonas vaginalis G3]EAY06655.1 hypothetical protein TVAG_322750 [Trichomonas vaginalis G3]KAI5552868.1 spectrin binding [Trichomonas vaginalis G3]|eukprot:XP_001318878.1 hypothetical protein [Trichomonas vaginalis G3]
MDELAPENRKIKYIADIIIPDKLKKYVELENMVFSITKSSERVVLDFINKNFTEEEMSFIPNLILYVSKFRCHQIDPLTLLYMSFTVQHGFSLPLDSIQNYNLAFADCLMHRGAFSETERSKNRQTELINQQETDHITFEQTLQGYKDPTCIEYLIKIDNLEGVKEKSVDYIGDDTKKVKISKDDYPRPDKQMTPINLAAFYGSYNSFHFFLLNSGKITQDTVRAAIQGGNMDIVKYVYPEIRHSYPEVNDKSRAFNWAIHWHHNNIADYLLSEGATCKLSKNNFYHWYNINAALFMIQNGKVPIDNRELLEALKALQQRNNIASFRAYLLYACPIDFLQRVGDEILFAVCKSGSMTAARLLLELGVNPNSEDGAKEQALNIACEQGHEALVKLLLENGAKVDCFDEKNCYPLHKAIGAKREKIVNLLFSRNPDLNIKTKQNESLLIVSCRMMMFGIAKTLIKKGADINFPDWNGMTAFHYVCEFSDRDTVEFFIWNGADINKETDAGMTPFHFVCKGGKMETISLLIANGCTLNPKTTLNRETTPLHFACMSGNLIIVKFLVEKGYNINMKSCIADGGMTPLHYACQGGHFEIAKFLILKGADTEISSDLASDSKTASMFASDYLDRALNSGDIQRINIGTEFKKLFQSLSVS